MSQSPSKLRSPCGGNLRSACQQHWRFKTAPTSFFVVTGFQPVWGFGTFKTAPGAGNYSFYNTLYNAGFTFNDSWPNVYATLTENWDDGVNPPSQTVSAFAPYIDAPFSVQNPVSGGNANATGAFSAFVISSDGLSVTATYTWYPPLFPGGPGGTTPAYGTYSATLTNPVLTSWAAAASAADALLANVTLPATPSFTQGSVCVFPTLAAPGYFICNTTSSPVFDGLPVSAAMRGMPCRQYTTTSMSGPPPSIAAGGNVGLGLNVACILTAGYNIDTPTGVGTVPNVGGCISLKSVWLIAGEAATDSRSGENQLELYLQSYDGVSAVGPIQSAPNPFNLQATGSYPFPNPFGTAIPIFLTFGPGDVTSLLNAAPGAADSAGGAGSSGIGAGDAGAGGMGAGGQTILFGILDFNSTNA